MFKFIFINMSVFKIHWQQQFLLLLPMIIRYFILLGLYLYFVGFHFNTTFIIISSFVFLTDILPTLILHTQYLVSNWNSILRINEISKTVEFENSYILGLKYNFEDIDVIEYYCSYGRGTGWYSFERYRYCKLKFKDSQSIIITSLMINRIENQIKNLTGHKVDKHLKVLALIS